MMSATIRGIPDVDISDFVENSYDHVSGKEHIRPTLLPFQEASLASGIESKDREQLKVERSINDGAGLPKETFQK